jgi:lipoprotein-anchoring transpeptidase ErfK/SrfK
MTSNRYQRTAVLAIAFVGLWGAPASAQFLGFAPAAPQSSIFGEVLREGESLREQGPGEAAELPARFRRQTVSYATTEAPGTIVVDTPNTYLYYVLGGGKAVRYGIGVGREGFTWSGTQTVTRKAEWPDWNPPAEMISRQPYLPRFVAGGPGNPLGARAMYLGSSIYRIHGTNQPHTIGGRVSSGCIRMVNEDVTDLYSRVHVG